MAKVRLPKYIVVPDTNSLFTPKPEFIVSPQFDEYWTECRGITELTLCVPEVVKSELVYKQVYLARQSIDSATKNFKTIADVTQVTAIKLPEERTVYSQVLGTFNMWRKKTSASVVKTPINTINWKDLIHAAVWRIPPFSPLTDPDKPTEKGFRDAIILETLLGISSSHKSDNVVFLTNDYLLIQAAKSRFLTSDSRMVFANAKEFAAWLRLLKTTKTEEITKQLIAQAGELFFIPKNNTTLYYSLGVAVQIQDKYAGALNNPTQLADTNSRGLPFPSLATNMQEYASSAYNIGWTLGSQLKPISDEHIYIGRTDYEKLEDDKRFNWITRIEYVRLFESLYPTVLMYGTNLHEKLRIARFDVKWSAITDENGKLTDGQLTSVELTEQKVELAENLKQKYGFIDKSDKDA